MKKLLVVLLLFIYLSAGCIGLSAKDIDIEPETITLDLIAGNITKKELTVKWTGEKPVECNINTIITPDDTGINISYSNNQFVAIPDKEYTIQMVIETDLALTPGTYIINTIISHYHKDLSLFSHMLLIPIFLFIVCLVIVIWIFYKQKNYIDKKIDEVKK